MYGHGYGAVDIWNYKSNYDIDKDTVRDGIITTKEDKALPWGVSVEFSAGYQMGYMRSFLEKYEWWKLVPCFDDIRYFSGTDSYYSIAHIDDELFIAYFYDHSIATGTLTGLNADVAYTYQWFNPRTAVTGSPQPVTKTGSAFWIGNRPNDEDWVLIVKKA